MLNLIMPAHICIFLVHVQQMIKAVHDPEKVKGSLQGRNEMQRVKFETVAL